MSSDDSTNAPMMPSVQDPRFGRLRSLPASEGWTHEGRYFTPWLAENLDLLGVELGLELRLVKREHPIGRYSLDLLLEDAEGRTVAVENQFGRTDHDHLGKVLTYCAGAEAKVVIWIAETLTEEHVAALEWLNENTVEDVGFFGVEFELLAIDDSKPAPHFRVVVKPNGWVKRVRRESPPRRTWTREEILAELDGRGDTQAAVAARGIFDWIHESDLDLKVRFHHGLTGGWFTPYLDTRHGALGPFSVGTTSGGSLEVNFQYLARTPPFDDERKREELRSRLNAIQGIEIPPTALRGRPSISLALLADSGILARFLEAMEWVFAQVEGGVARPGS